MTEAGYSTLMARVGGVLEAASPRAAPVTSLQCVKCGLVWSAAAARLCPSCGSAMVLELEPAPGAEHAEDTGAVSLGIPACEMLDLAVISDGIMRRTRRPVFLHGMISTETPGGNGGGGGLNTSGSPTERSYLSHAADPVRVAAVGGVAVSVKADIHCHTVNSPDTALPDLLPRPEPRRSSSPAPGDAEPEERKERSVPRSDSSSDISVLSNPSEASIEVLTSGPASPQHQLLQPPAAETTTLAVTPPPQLDTSTSTASDSLVASVVRPEPAAEEDMCDIFTAQETPPSSAYSSTQTSPAKRPRDPELEADTTVFLSCLEDSSNTDTDSHDDTQHQDTTVVSPEPPPLSPDPAIETSPILWNYQDFTKVIVRQSTPTH